MSQPAQDAYPELPVQRLPQGAPGYPPRLMAQFGTQAPPTLTVRGAVALLHKPLLGLFCSSACPAPLALQADRLAQRLQQAGVAVVGGFHSEVERACLVRLLAGEQPVVVCPARSITDWRFPKTYSTPLKAGRLLLLAPFPDTQRRVTTDNAITRNLVVAALARAVLVLHAPPTSKTFFFCRELLAWGKPVYTPHSPHNVNLVRLGAQPFDADAPDLLPALLGC